MPTKAQKRRQNQKRRQIRAKRLRTIEAANLNVANGAAIEQGEPRRVIDKTGEKLKREASAYRDTVNARMRLYDVDKRFAKSKECGTGLGRLLNSLQRSGEISRMIANDYLDAAQRFQEIVTAYDKDIIGAPSPNPAAINLMAVGGLSTGELDAETVKAITNRYMRLRAALDSHEKRNVLWRVLRQACIEDADMDNWRDDQVRHLLTGLRVVRDAC